MRNNSVTPIRLTAEQWQQRLEDGYTRIENARQLGQDVAAWEDFWIDLLHQYERDMDAAFVNTERGTYER